MTMDLIYCMFITLTATTLFFEMMFTFFCHHVIVPHFALPSVELRVNFFEDFKISNLCPCPNLAFSEKIKVSLDTAWLILLQIQ